MLDQCRFFINHCHGHHFGFGKCWLFLSGVDVTADDVEVAICKNHKCMREVIGRDLSPSFDCQVLLEPGKVNSKSLNAP